MMLLLICGAVDSRKISECPIQIGQHFWLQTIWTCFVAQRLALHLTHVGLRFIPDFICIHVIERQLVLNLRESLEGFHDITKEISSFKLRRVHYTTN